MVSAHIQVYFGELGTYRDTGWFFYKTNSPTFLRVYRIIEIKINIVFRRRWERTYNSIPAIPQVSTKNKYTAHKIL